MKKILTLIIMLATFLSASAYKKESVDINVNGQTRNMVVFTPNTMTANLPLMIVTHGMGQSPEYQYDGDKLYELIDTEKFVVAYLRSDGSTWDVGGDKDINFVSQSIDEMYNKHQINKNRVYWSGFSMGSMLIYHSMAKMADKIAAFAPTSGIQFSEQPWNALKNAGKKVNLIAHHSNQDEVFPINQYDVKTYVTNIANIANEQTTYFESKSYTSQEGNYKGLKQVWTNTNTGNVVELFMYDGGGHWPSYYNRKEIWQFCKQFSKLTAMEEFNQVYQHGQNLLEEWKYTDAMTAKGIYSSLKKAIEETYTPEKMEGKTDSQISAATTKLNTIIASFEKTCASITMVVPSGDIEQPTTVDPNFHIYLCFGQSNMEGNAAIEAQDRKDIDPRFMMMAAVDMSNMNRKKFQWYTAYPPLCRGGNGLTPADYFGRTMVENLPDSIKVGVINVAVGGASIKLFDEDLCASQIAGAADWFKNYCKEYDNDPYKRLVECAKEAQKVGVIKGILLHQGCTDNGQKDWPVRVKRVYIRLLNDLGLNEAETPLLVGELLQQAVGGVCWGHNSVIAKTKNAIPNAHVISSKSCPAASDGLHFTAEGYRMIGKRYGEKMLTLLDSVATIDFDTTNGLFPTKKGSFNPSLCLEGTYSGSTAMGTFTPTDLNGFGGWRYSKGQDMSYAKYLVIELARENKQATLKIFDTDDYLNPCYSLKLSGKKIVVDLEDMKDANGNKIDPSHIYMVGFSLATTAALNIKSVYLSDDGENPTDVISLNAEQHNAVSSEYFSLSGMRIAEPAKGTVSIRRTVFGDGKVKTERIIK